MCKECSVTFYSFVDFAANRYSTCAQQDCGAVQGRRGWGGWHICLFVRSGSAVGRFSQDSGSDVVFHEIRRRGREFCVSVQYGGGEVSTKTYVTSIAAGKSPPSTFPISLPCFLSVIKLSLHLKNFHKLLNICLSHIQYFYLDMGPQGRQNRLAG